MSLHDLKDIFKKKKGSLRVTKTQFFILLRDRDIETKPVPTINYAEAFPTLELVEAELKVRTARFPSMDYQIWELRRFTPGGN